MIPLPFIDLHSHLIPAVDDGARNAFDARDGLAVLASDGVRRVVATPHVQASILADPAARARRMTELDMGWRLLRNVRDELPEDAPVLERGIELLLDAPEPDLSDPRLRLAGGSAVLVEFPFLRIPMYAERQLAGLIEAGWTPVVAHVERYAELGRSLAQIARWREMGAVLQVNAGSLLGRYGARPRRRARHLLASGWTSLLASDYHARGGPPALREARGLLLRQTRAAEEGGGEDGGTGVRGATRLLMGENPRRLLEGRRVLPVPPLARRAAWRRWLGGGD
ncbi:MAG: CpsB/CapC family capsule biosynthesis tyrosine phosphatase [Candidatus Palauibacterales bacterium]|nr:CpsB/CapC family capsule biosynthesis tyrosine phosphatase [Candidatus Palauibacterales bacterium]MDP2528421.1 CpsB/CapC family capsule biosynthesis tyrosine phosphatase [Candidatus Palauibacterales bacterium]MDP2583713.1 CpsB/CapC family capsule biosynthesis tyrosine phosphatase [Candidatus Palauibacterales bacterium]